MSSCPRETEKEMRGGERGRDKRREGGRDKERKEEREGGKDKERGREWERERGRVNTHVGGIYIHNYKL